MVLTHDIFECVAVITRRKTIEFKVTMMEKSVGEIKTFYYFGDKDLRVSILIQIV